MTKPPPDSADMVMFDDDGSHLRSRIASALLAAGYVGFFGATAGSVIAVRVFLFCVFPLACIWFPAAMGDRTGGQITKKSPAVFVFVLGWVVLLLPITMFIVSLLVWIT